MRPQTVSTLNTGHITDALVLCQRIKDLRWPITEQMLNDLQQQAYGVACDLRIHSGIDGVRVTVMEAKE